MADDRDWRHAREAMARAHAERLRAERDRGANRLRPDQIDRAAEREASRDVERAINETAHTEARSRRRRGEAL